MGRVGGGTLSQGFRQPSSRAVTDLNGTTEGRCNGISDGSPTALGVYKLDYVDVLFVRCIYRTSYSKDAWEEAHQLTF